MSSRRQAGRPEAVGEAIRSEVLPDSLLSLRIVVGDSYRLGVLCSPKHPIESVPVVTLAG
ncbi:MAG: hypothetical protein OXB98_16555 [Bryobacterales bacterium]|nr:hypothetical protein [Bryobacterales bacterium]